MVTSLIATKEMRVRYLLVALGLSAVIVGLFGAWREFGNLWLIVGTILIGIGLATIDIVAAIRMQPHQHDYAKQLELFRNAARTGDSKSMATMLQEGGVPEDLARSTADNMLRENESPAA